MLNDAGILDAGYHLDLSATAFANFNVNVAYMDVGKGREQERKLCLHGCR